MKVSRHQHRSTELRDQATETVEDAMDQVRTEAHRNERSVRKGADHRHIRPSN